MIMWLLYHIVILCIQTLLSSLELTIPHKCQPHKTHTSAILVKIVQEHKKI